MFAKGVSRRHCGLTIITGVIGCERQIRIFAIMSIDEDFISNRWKIGYGGMIHAPQMRTMLAEANASTSGTRAKDLDAHRTSEEHHVRVGTRKF